MIVEVIVSTNKLLSNPTGSEIITQSFDESIHEISVSVCKVFESFDQYTDAIPSVKSVTYQNETFIEMAKEYEYEYENDYDQESSSMFSWVNDQSYLCKSFSFKGKEFKIIHNAFGSHDQNLHIYLHKTGFLGSGLEVKINKQWYPDDNILLLEIVELHLIAEETNCTDEGMLEECREGYISAAVNKITGCILKYMR